MVTRAEEKTEGEMLHGVMVLCFSLYALVNIM